LALSVGYALTMAIRARPTATTSDPSFPGIEALEALDRWSRSPTPRRRGRLISALGTLVATAGARGGLITIVAPPLPEASFGFGSLVGGTVERHHPALTLTRHVLRAPGRTSLATLWLDAPNEARDTAVHAVTLVLESAWSRATVRRTVERLEALDEATRGIASVLDLDLVLQLIVDRVRDLIGASYAALGIVTPGGEIERFITSGISDDVRTAIGPPPHGRGLLGLIIREGRSYRIPAIASHPDSSGFPPNHPPMTSFLGVPVAVKGRPIGNLYLTDKQGSAEFSAADQELVETFALHAGIAIDNARLHEQVQRLAVVEDRERISRDLHDGIIQGIYAVALSLEDVPDLLGIDRAEAVGRIDRAIDALNLTIRDIRNFILGLRSEFLDGADLEAGLATLAQDFGLNSPIEVSLDLEAGRGAAQRLAIDDRVHLLQMVREALSNTARHAQARAATVRVEADDAEVTVTIADDGVGFDPAMVQPSGHLGLANLRDRAARMGGSAEVDSRPGAGTRVMIRLPLTDGDKAP
jgi:signal transduction histidine kinase